MDRLLVEDRLEQTLTRRLRPAIYSESISLQVESWQVPDEPVSVAEALAASYNPFTVGSMWGPAWSTMWLRVRGKVPAAWSGRRVEAVIDLGFSHPGPGRQAEGLVYDSTGLPIKGLAPRTNYVPIAAPAQGNEDVLLYVEAAANPFISAMVGEGDPRGDKLTADTELLYQLTCADLAVLDEDVWQLVLDIEVLSELMHELPANEPRRHEILRALERMLDTLDPHDVSGSAGRARWELTDMLARQAHASAHRISAVAHAHIDTAWMWPLRETIRKSSRTFSNVLALARDYPELVFACSQAQQYAWIKEFHPPIFAGIKTAVQSGNWEPVGGMWVESDTYLPGSEALARQLIHGTRFFVDEFGVETDGIWLPDSFGYTGAFPQLAKLVGARWFLIQKLSWNDTNRFPHNSFWWEGIDGTRIFAHQSPIDTYASTLSGSELAHAVHSYAENGFATTSLAMYGYGDGGGGPTREMLEKARRLGSLEGSPTVTVESASSFFDKAMSEYPDAPVWSGELYLELHRATFTSQAKMKSGNRLSERLLREAELWSATAALHGDFAYPYDQLDQLWKTVLLHQFHDILPGTSIAWVHREARAAYEKAEVELEDIIRRAAAALPGTGPGASSFLNAAPHERAEVMAAPLELADGVEVTQNLSDGRTAVWVEAPALGIGATTVGLPASKLPVTVSDGVLDNGLIRVTVDETGVITSLYDYPNARETLAAGDAGNLLQLHPDNPSRWDAWELDRNYRHSHVDLTEADSVQVVDSGPLLGSIRVQRSFGKSSLTQTLVVRAGSSRLDVLNEIDWYESGAILKAAFPFDIHADRESAEIQFGHVHRPTHSNTSWDAARFELYAHRWVHIDEAGYGVALLTDSTYGHDINRHARDGRSTTTTVRLTLLRAPRNPDPKTDQGVHRFTYAVLPGATISDAVAEGYALNIPLRSLDTAHDLTPLVTVDNPAVVVEAVKLADDRSGDIVVRLYESLGGKAHTAIHTNLPLQSANLVDLLERPLTEVRSDGDVVRLALQPFEICTLRLSRQP
ncbi:MAG TPA: glycoside hydrolase family 38 C-terminal domain-containing protein [Kribbella sp.]|uniref:alpha-mannosidase n=1 Tax=Kribbella sp. TaxID=1871183 RepID=UPI002D76CC4C|nr:glycoside hydrolase family 38 C-terminal domain-containing protein [Kribbella sp.]HET6295877.1 glycoside hydrolase family 38 C-terminal domain-containing protein [Kribbella sp.]